MPRDPRQPLDPDTFLWGVSSSAFQIEGAPAADWAEWKVKDHRDREARLRGVGHREREQTDLALLGEIGVNAYRFSVEWSRVVPARGEWNAAEVERYVRICDHLRERGIEPVVTLYHFTSPAWLKREGLDWTHESFLSQFLGFATEIVKALAGRVRLWITLNEPNVQAAGGFLAGVTPPGRRGFSGAHRALANMLRAHARLFEVIHACSPEGAAVGIALNMLCFAPDNSRSRMDRWAADTAERLYNGALIDAFQTGVLALRLLPWSRVTVLPVRDRLDFLGVNYYSRAHVGFSVFHHRRPRHFWEDRSGRGLTAMGWEVYPQGLSDVLEQAATLGVPLLITENGAAESEDARKISYLRDHLEEVERCRARGMDIRGYFWWSLLDNYEWLMGLGPRFGLYHVDYDTLERTATDAAAEFARLSPARADTIGTTTRDSSHSPQAAPPPRRHG